MTDSNEPPPRASGQTKEPHLSFSQLRTYANCSLLWWFQRRYKPEFVSTSLVFGTAFHFAIQTYYQGRLEARQVDKDRMLRAFDRAFGGQTTEVRFGKNETPASLRALAGRMVDAFLANVRDSQVIAVEEPIRCELAAGLPPLIGYIDLIEVRTDDDGVKWLHLVDFKTAAKRPSEDDIDPEQLTLYAIAAFRFGLMKQFDLPLALRYEFITKTKTPEVISLPFTPYRHDAQRLIAKAKVCWHGMQAGVCFPNRSWMCGNCGYQRRCEKWPEHQ